MRGHFWEAVACPLVQGSSRSPTQLGRSSGLQVKEAALVGPGSRGGLHSQKCPRAEGSWGRGDEGRGLCTAGLAFVPIF